MNQIEKALVDSIGYINLGILFIFGGLLLIAMLSVQLNSSITVVLTVIVVISGTIVFFGIKRFNRYRVHFKTKKLMYAALIPNVLGLALMSAGLSLLFAYRLPSSSDGRFSIFLQPYATYAVIMILIGCGLGLLALKFYHDFPKQIVHEPKINT